VEDYEYLVMASQADVAAAMREAVQIGCNGDSSANGFHHWNTDAAALLDARSRLAAIIESARRSRSTAAEPRGTGAGAPRSGRGR
jgi:hypothetical protein